MMHTHSKNIILSLICLKYIDLVTDMLVNPNEQLQSNWFFQTFVSSDSKYTLFDYGIDRNQLIEVHKRIIFDDVKKDEKVDKVDDAEEDANSDKENEGKNSEPKVSTEGMT